jgi:hypothetical protein
MSDGDWIKLREIEGMESLNGKEFQIKVKDPFHFYLKDCDTSDLDKHKLY